MPRVSAGADMVYVCVRVRECACVFGVCFYMSMCAYACVCACVHACVASVDPLARQPPPFCSTIMRTDRLYEVRVEMQRLLSETDLRVRRL